MQECYTNYEEPITEMKKFSELHIPFSFTHKKRDGSNVSIRKAILRKQSRNKKSKYLLAYTNLETNEQRNCYIPLLTSFNNKLIDVSK